MDKKVAKVFVKLKVRLAKVSDAKRIAALSGELGYPIDARRMGRLIHLARRRGNQRLFAAEVDGTVVGWLEIFRSVSVLNPGKTEIGALVVGKRYRRRGIGAALMNEAHRWARSKGSPFVYLRSNIVRRDAHRFYERSGYSVFKTQYVFRKTFAQRKPKER